MSCFVGRVLALPVTSPARATFSFFFFRRLLHCPLWSVGQKWLEFGRNSKALCKGSRLTVSNSSGNNNNGHFYHTWGRILGVMSPHCECHIQGATTSYANVNNLHLANRPTVNVCLQNSSLAITRPSSRIKSPAERAGFTQTSRTLFFIKIISTRYIYLWLQIS